ncbi:hypothetical protein H5S09_02775 [Limosilactobacillus sp. STM2_1]|uniref:Uncharacterized protein n=1 Tax=Limosilactobacillus rudii TaxID=2759755 RepID=A0A7W3UJR7_9LACO|nr:hypothetical protein [Limosilactobacillus rudii]MBB1080222.1 hypothetical protein [Limosilactobacillus rudii]MBB1096874.1 hypothetical protein [Limosilactobacillus rudii]MCD7133772.1 hypothetical protein [Limosilactobacillus rudii]
MTTDDFISKVNDLNGVYASKQREDHRMLINIFKTCNHMCFAEVLVKERVLNLFCRPQSTEVAEDVLQELFRLICDYQEEK